MKIVVWVLVRVKYFETVKMNMKQNTGGIIDKKANATIEFITICQQ